MINVIAHELAELSLNLFVNACYYCEGPIALTEIGDLREDLYSSGSGSGYIGQVMKDGGAKKKEGTKIGRFRGNKIAFAVSLYLIQSPLTKRRQLKLGLSRRARRKNLSD
ncbi:hypothetical protein RJ640_010904 [Escallonia rubra]|uniref:Uncharacterized protein n=1 Tax=Escallonia rubra TaxID=112253 RepID=A0AA88RSJ1_9ASTE|nr:hypothetical protein RJ640_010904 [Escallonia rubra]